MRKKIIITRKQCLDHPWGFVCGCPLHDALKKAGFPVSEVELAWWRDTLGQKHRLSRPFSDVNYANVIISKKPFVIMVDDSL